jgi:hypothetical protein
VRNSLRTLAKTPLLWLPLFCILTSGLLGVPSRDASAAPVVPAISNTTATCPKGWTGAKTCQRTYETAGTYNLTVPAGVSSMQLVVHGAPGGNAAGSGGGAAGYVDGVAAVTPGEGLTIVVGAPGATTYGPTGAAGGSGGGGAGGDGSVYSGSECAVSPCDGYGGGGGGGGSFVFSGHDLLAAGAGGAGGGGEGNGGGSGGGADCVGSGTTCPDRGVGVTEPSCSSTGIDTSCGGTPGTQTSGGAPGTLPAGEGASGASGTGPASGSAQVGTGGTGGSATTVFGCAVGYPPMANAENGGGGGGGGYFGGGGGAPSSTSSSITKGAACPYTTSGGGGGGSNYASPALSDVSIGSGAIAPTPGVQLTYTQSSLIVNSTKIGVDTTEASEGVCNADPSSASPECTLPQAIDVANASDGGTIMFDIKKGHGNAFDGDVPQIEAGGGTGIATGMPNITRPTTIDGTSQPDAHRVELSGSVQFGSVTRGFLVRGDGSGSTITGMVINGFQEMIRLEAGNDTIQGNWLGTDTKGTAADPTPLGANPNPELPLAQVGIKIDSSGNTIGGSSAAQGNAIASGYTVTEDEAPVTTYGLFAAGEIDDTTGGNIIQGNEIGYLPSSSSRLLDPTPPTAFPLAVEPALSLSGGADTVGGDVDGQGNVIGGGGTISSAGTLLQGNTITDGGLHTLARDGTPVLNGPLVVSATMTVGGPTTTPGEYEGNTFRALDPDNYELGIDDASGVVVEGNVFKGDITDEYGAIRDDDGTDLTIGGTSADGTENVFKDTATEVVPPPPDQPGATRVQPAAVTIIAPDATGASNAHVLIEHNDFDANGDSGAVDVEDGYGVTVTQNEMTNNGQGIALGDQYYYDGQSYAGTADRPPNDLLEYPILASVSESDGTTQMTARLDETATYAGDEFEVQLYAASGCGTPVSTQGATYLGSQSVTSILGQETIAASYAALPAGDDAVTATVIGPDGSTSEFSPCLALGQSPTSFPKAGVTPTSTTVAITTDATSSAVRTDDHAATTGSGALELICPVLTTGSCKGTYTLRISGSTPTRVAHGRFTTLPGEVSTATISLRGNLLSTLEKDHRVKAILVVKAHDATSPPTTKDTTTRLTLKYKR